MKLIKKVILITLSVCTATLVFGCTPKNIIYNNFDTKMFYANYKQDANFSAGKKSAMYNDRIYYQSAEQGEKGLYSMEKDGSDVKIEIPVEDMRKVQITDNGIYLVEYIGKSENHHGEFRQFDLFNYPNGKDSKEMVLEEDLYPDLKKDDTYGYNIWDFYYKDDNTLLINNVQPDLPRPFMIQCSYFLSADGLVYCKDFNVYIKMKIFKNSVERNLFNFYEYNDIWFTSRQTLYDEDMLQGLYEQMQDETVDYETYMKGGNKIWITSFLDVDKNIAIMGPALGDNSFFRTLEDRVDYRMIYSNNKRGVIITALNEIGLLDIEKEELTKVKELKDKKYVVFLIDLENKAYFITQSSSDINSVYTIDLESLETKKMYGCSNNEKVLWLDKETLVTAKGKEIRIQEIADEKVREKNKITLEENIIQKEYKTDVSGEWLFIYKFEETQNSDILQYKVNLETGVVVKCV